MKVSCGGVGSVPSIAWLVACTVGCGSVKDAANDAASEPIDDAPADVAIPPDADPAIRYDIAYISELTLTPSISSLFSFLVVVNSGTAPLTVTQASVVSFTDDNPGIDWKFLKETDAMKALDPARAAGALSAAARAKIVTTGLVPEVIDDSFLNFSMSFASPPPAGITINAQAVIRIDGRDTALPFVIHFVASGDPELTKARRVNSPP